MEPPHKAIPSQQQASSQPERWRTPSSYSSDSSMSPSQISDASASSSSTDSDYDETTFTRSVLHNAKRLSHSHKRKLDKLKTSEKDLKDQLEDKKQKIEVLNMQVQLHEDNCTKQQRRMQHQDGRIRKLRYERVQKVREIRKVYEISLVRATQQHQSQLMEMEAKHNEELQKLREEMNKALTDIEAEKEKTEFFKDKLLKFATIFRKFKDASKFGDELPETEEPCLPSEYFEPLTDHLIELLKMASAIQLPPEASSSNASELHKNGNSHTSPLFPSPPLLVPYYEGDANENNMDITREPICGAESVEHPQQQVSLCAGETPSQHSLYVSKVRKSPMTESAQSNIPGKSTNQKVARKARNNGNNECQRRRRPPRQSKLEGEGKFKCPKCENVRRFAYLSKMKRHMKLVHGIPDAFENMIGCAFCGEMFLNKSLLQAHQIDAHQRIYNRNFGYKPSVKSSVGAILPDPVEPTAAPTTACTSNGVLNSTDGALLLKNEAKHSVDTQFSNQNVCICGEKFKNWNGLKRHMRIYNLGKIFRCQYCKEVFLEFRRLKGHFQSCHKNVQCETFECALCPRDNESLFESRLSVEEHCIQFHGIRPF